MRIIDHFLWVSTKGFMGFSIQESQWRLGVLGFVLPIFCVFMVIEHLLEKVWHIEVPVILLVIISLLPIILIYNYYKCENRGEKIMDYYNHKKTNNRYIIALFVFLYYIFFCIAALFSCSLIDYMMK